MFSMKMFEVANKVAIVTGGNQGLGKEYAIALARAGADIYIPHFTEEIDSVRNAVEAEGRRVFFSHGDLTDSDYRGTVVADCLKRLGRIDILVNNAGIGKFGGFESYPEEDYRFGIELNLNVPYFLSRQAAEAMVAAGHGGKIINIGSALSFTSDRRCPPYTVSKHGVLGLTRMLANELGRFDIQTNAICPGFFITEMTQSIKENESLYGKISQRIPSGEWGSPEDLAGALVFLASDASRYVNGWFINVDGGFQATI